MENKDELIKIFSKRIRQILSRMTIDFQEVQEIRLRVGAPLIMIYKNHLFLLNIFPIQNPAVCVLLLHLTFLQ